MAERKPKIDDAYYYGQATELKKILAEKDKRIKELEERGNRLENMRQANWERADDLEKENADLKARINLALHKCLCPTATKADIEKALRGKNGL